METLKLFAMNAIKSFRIFSLIVLTVLFFGNLDAQDDILISTGGTVTACGGYFFDDGDIGDQFGGPYSDNDYSITICPDNPGDAVSVVFLAFELQTNANPNNNDVLAYAQYPACNYNATTNEPNA